MLRYVSMTENPAAGNLVQPVRQAFDQSHFVLPDYFQAFFENVLDAGGQPGNAQNVGRAAFQEIGKLARLGFAGGIASGATLAPGAELRARSDVERACPGRPQQRLVTSKSQHVDAHRLISDRQYARRLRHVSNKENVPL